MRSAMCCRCRVVQSLDVRRTSIALLVAALSSGACGLFAEFSTLADTPSDASFSPDAAALDDGATDPATATDRDAMGDAECVLGRCIVSQHRVPDSKDEAPSDGTSSIPCPALGKPAYGQDCNYRTSVPSFATTADIAVDTVTGLVWERQSQGTFTRAQIVTHCQTLATGSFAGFGDWRVPTAREAITLINSGKNIQGLDQTVFTSQVHAWMWTQTPWAGSGAAYLRLPGDFPSIEEAADTQAGLGSRCVRGGPLPEGAYVVSASGAAVEDPRTGLTWQRVVASGTRAWLDALAYCNGLVLEGTKDWRLPSYKELLSIVDFTRLEPAIDQAAFPGTPHQQFWSASPVGDMPWRAYDVDFASGAPQFSGGAPTTTLYGVRCVRGGT
jgi:hypothetical protein